MKWYVLRVFYHPLLFGAQTKVTGGSWAKNERDMVWDRVGKLKITDPNISHGVVNSTYDPKTTVVSGKLYKRLETTVAETEKGPGEFPGSQGAAFAYLAKPSEQWLLVEAKRNAVGSARIAATAFEKILSLASRELWGAAPPFDIQITVLTSTSVDSIRDFLARVEHVTEIRAEFVGRNLGEGSLPKALEMVQKKYPGTTSAVVAAKGHIAPKDVDPTEFEPALKNATARITMRGPSTSDEGEVTFRSSTKESEYKLAVETLPEGTSPTEAAVATAREKLPKGSGNE